MTRVCLLVGSFVTLVVIISKMSSPVFMKFGTDVQHQCQILLSTFERSRSKLRVKTAVLKVFTLQ